MNALIQDLSGSGIYHFFKTIGCRGVVEDDSVGISVLSTHQVDPTNCVLIHSPLRSVKYLSWLVQVVSSLCGSFTGSTAVKNTVCRRC